jgi:hypothetical protein
VIENESSGWHWQESTRHARVRLSSGEHPDEERGTAVRELVRAIALDPTNREHVVVLAKLIDSPPRTVPEAVQQRADSEAQAIVRRGAAYVAASLLSWLAFLPLMFAAGVLRYDYLLWIAVPAVITASLAFIASRTTRTSWPVQFVALGTLTIAATAMSRMFGPLILAPTVLAPIGIVIQAHPQRVIRIAGLALTAAALLTPLLLELSGILPSSYRFGPQGMTLVPQLTNLPSWFVFGFLGLANLSIAVVPAVLVGRMRAELAKMQYQEQVRSWHLSRIGDDLLSAER